VDEKIEQLIKKQELLGEYKKGLMQQIFSQAIRFKADDGCDFPDWEEKSLGELFNYKNGGSFENEVVKDGLYNLITLNSITIDGELKNEHKKINSFDNSLKINDLIMVLSDVAHGNFLGLTAIIPEDNSYVLNQRMGALKSKGLNNVVFLRLLINYNQKYFKLHGQGSSQQNLSKGDILKFELLLPNRNEQQKIANFLSSIDTKIEQVGKQLDESKQFKKALLQQMFV
jgi:type I restriction enzyme S subunit